MRTTDVENAVVHEDAVAKRFRSSGLYAEGMSLLDGLNQAKGFFPAFLRKMNKHTNSSFQKETDKGYKLADTWLLIRSFTDSADVLYVFGCKD